MSYIDFAEIAITEDGHLNLTCTLNGSNISWRRGEEFLSTGRILSKERITRNESGIYECRDSNNSSEEYNVIVQCMYYIVMPLRIIKY